MGMLLVYCRVSPRNAGLLLERPALIHRFLGNDDAPAPAPAKGLLGRLFGGGAKPAAPAPVLDPRTDGDEGDTDKAWNAIHYLLTGTAEGGSFPAGFILDGGQVVGNEEVGYGPARIFTPAEVAQIDAALAEHTEDDFKSRYDGPAMDAANVYPEIWGREDEDDFGYVWGAFADLRDFIRTTRASGDHLMIYLS